MRDCAEIVVTLTGLGVLLFVGTLLGTIILRDAVSLYNTLAGGAASGKVVPEPSVGKAMGITFVATLVNVAVRFIVGLFMVGLANTSSGVESEWSVISQLVSLHRFARHGGHAGLPIATEKKTTIFTGTGVQVSGWSLITARCRVPSLGGTPDEVVPFSRPESGDPLLLPGRALNGANSGPDGNESGVRPIQGQAADAVEWRRYGKPGGLPPRSRLGLAGSSRESRAVDEVEVISELDGRQVGDLVLPGPVCAVGVEQEPVLTR